MSDTSPPTKYTVGLVQMAMSADPAANLEQAIAKVAEAARAGARLVCLPELFRSRYFAQREDAALFDLAEPVPGPSTEALGRGGVYRKMHIPDDPAYYEKFYFTPGDLGFRAFDTRVGRIGTLDCWDQWY